MLTFWVIFFCWRIFIFFYALGHSTVRVLVTVAARSHCRSLTLSVVTAFKGCSRHACAFFTLHLSLINHLKKYMSNRYAERLVKFKSDLYTCHHPSYFLSLFRYSLVQFRIEKSGLLPSSVILRKISVGVSECIVEDIYMSLSHIDCAIVAALLTHACISVCAISTHGLAHSCGICICILRID